MSPSDSRDWRIEKADAERRMELARKSFRNAGTDARTFTGWKATAAIIAVVAFGALFLNWLGSATSKDPPPRPTPTVVRVTPA